MERKCLICGAKLTGRADRKFCSDFCRNSPINTKDKTKTTKNRLLQMGFSFDYFTSIYTTKAGATYFYLYDQGYLPLDNDFYLLVKKDID